MLATHKRSAAQFVTPVYAAMGGVSVNTSDAYSVFNNPATLALTGENSLSTSMYLPYLLPEIIEPAFAWQHVFKSLSFGLGMYREGNANLNRHQAVFCVSKQSGTLSYGIKARLAQTQINEYGTRNNLLVDVGATSGIIPKMQFGMQVTNINRARLDNSEFEYLPSFILAGVKYELADQVFFHLDCRQDFISGFDLKSGMEVKLRKVFLLRAGISTRPLKPHLGIGIKTGKWRFDAAHQVDHNLGPSQTIGLGYVWN